MYKMSGHLLLVSAVDFLNFCFKSEFMCCIYCSCFFYCHYVKYFFVEENIRKLKCNTVQINEKIPYRT